MPIRAEQKSRYPKDWKSISRRIRERDGNRCKWCDAPNGELIERDPRDRAKFRVHSHDGSCLGEDCGAVRVVLTVAHLDHAPENCADENLVALCQRCHLRYDAPEHRRNAAATRRRKADARSGQAALFEAIGGAA